MDDLSLATREVLGALELSGLSGEEMEGACSESSTLRFCGIIILMEGEAAATAGDSAMVLICLRFRRVDAGFAIADTRALELALRRRPAKTIESVLLDIDLSLAVLDRSDGANERIPKR